MSTATPHRLMAACLLGMASAAAIAGGSGTNCPNNPSTLGNGGAPSGSSNLQPAFTDLQPGVGYALPPTDAATNPDLVGAVVKTLLLPYTWTSTGGTAIGTLYQVISGSSTSNKCAASTQVAASSNSTLRVCAFRIGAFNYPAPNQVYAAYRTDSIPAGDVIGKKVKRSGGEGKVVRFEFKRCLNPTELSEQMVLVFEAPQVGKDSYVQLEGEDGSLSPKLRVYGPRLP